MFGQRSCEMKGVDPLEGAEEELTKETNEIPEIQRGGCDLRYGSVDYDGGKDFFMIQIDKAGATNGRIIVAPDEVAAQDIFNRLRDGNNTAEDNDHILGNATFVVSEENGRIKVDLADTCIELLVERRAEHDKKKAEMHSGRGTFEQAA